MRDILLVCFLIVATYFTFRKPFIGVAAWLWIALMAPSQWAFGFSQSFRLNFTIGIVAAIAYLFSRDKARLKFTGMYFVVLLFAFWMLLASIFHNQLDSALVWDKCIEFMKVIALFLFLTLTVRTENQLNTIIWAILFAVSAYAAMEACKFILSGGGHRITGRSGIISDRNDLAVAINMCLPLILYLWHTTENKKLKMGLLLLFFLNIIAVVGTFSRGGFIGLSVLAVAVWWRSKHKLAGFVLALVSLTVLYVNVPEEWKARQMTVMTAVEEDGSFIGRLWAWKIATLIAIDNPVTGGGFKATTDPFLWSYYALETPDFGFIETPPIPEYVKPKAAHNIYFQVLASSGFVGIGIFLSMLVTGLMSCMRNVVLARRYKIPWLEYLSNALFLSLVGYAITGLNVSLAYFELVYALLAMIMVVRLEITRISGLQTKNSV